MGKKLTQSQLNALGALMTVHPHRLRGKDGWASGNTVNFLLRTGLCRYDRDEWETVLTEAGREAFGIGRFTVAYGYVAGVPDALNVIEIGSSPVDARFRASVNVETKEEWSYACVHALTPKQVTAYVRDHVTSWPALKQLNPDA